MEQQTFILNFASGISMLLVIYASYMFVRNSNSDFAYAFKIILIGHMPSTILHFLSSLSFFGFELMPNETSFLYYTLNYIFQLISTLSVFFAIYTIKKVLYDKIEWFKKRYKDTRGTRGIRDIKGIRGTQNE